MRLDEPRGRRRINVTRRQARKKTGMVEAGIGLCIGGVYATDAQSYPTT